MLEADSSKADAVLAAFESRLNKLGQKAFPASRIAPPNLARNIAAINALERAYANLARAQARAAGAPGPRPPAGGPGAGGYGGGRGNPRIDRMEQAGYRNQMVGSRLKSTFTDPLIGAGKNILEYSANFEEAMQKTVTLASVGKSELDGLKRSVLGLSADPNIRKGAAELAEGLYYVTSTGRKGAEGMDLLRASALGASAGLGETKVVANIVTTVLDSYGLASEKAIQVTDTLTQAVRMGKGEATQLAGSFGKVVAIASQAGVSFEEVAAQMASATRMGLTASETATALRQIFNNLVDPSDKSARAMRALGTSVDEVRAKLREKGLFNTLKDLMQRSGGQIGPITELFGNIRALTGFLSTTGTATLGKYRETLDAINNGQGATLKAAASASETFTFQLDKLKTTAEATAISLGTKYLPMLNRLAKSGQINLGALPGAWSRMGEGEKAIAGVTAGFLALAGPLNLVIGNTRILYSLFVSMASLGGSLTGVAALLTNPALIAVLAGGALIGGVALWLKFSRSLEEAKKQTADLTQNAKNLEAAMAKATSGTTNPKVKATLDKVRKATADAGDDAAKLQKALELALSAKHEIKALGLAPNAADPLLNAVERYIKGIEDRKIHLGIQVDAPTPEVTAAMEQLGVIYRAQDRAAGIQAGVNQAVSPAYSAHIDRALNQNKDNLRELMKLQDEYNRRSAPRAVSDVASGHSTARLDVATGHAVQRPAAARAWAPTQADIDAIGRVNARVKELEDKGHKERLKAQKDAAQRAASLETQRRKQAEAEADRARQAEMKSLGERVQMWQAFGGAVEGVLGRIVAISEQGSVLTEKTAKSRLEAQLLKSTFDGIPSPLKQAAVELAGIEVTMGRIVGQRDGFRALFNDMAQGMTSSQLKNFAPRVDQFGKSLKLGNQMSAAQERARALGTDLSGTVDANRRGLLQQQERLQFAGTKQAGVYDPMYPSEGGGSGGLDNRTFDAALTQAIIKGVNTPMGAMACARFVNKAFGILGIEGVKKTESAAQQERNALAAGAKRIPVSQAGAGDLLVGPGGGPSGRHVGIGVGNGKFAAKNKDRYSSISGYNFDAAYDTSALARSARLTASTSQAGVPNIPDPNWRGWGHVPGAPPINYPPGTAPGTQTSTRIANVPLAPQTAARNINLPAFEKLDTSLLTRRGMPAGWGGMMNDHAAKPGESTRYRAAMEEYLLGEMGKGTRLSGQQLQGARQLANQSDLNQSMNEARAATKQRLRQFSHEMRMIGREDNPYLALLLEIQEGMHDFDKPGAQKELGLRLAGMKRMATLALEAERRQVTQQRSVSAAGNKYLQGAAPDFFAAQQAREAREAEIAAWSNKETVNKFELEQKGALPRGSTKRYALDLQAIARAGREQSQGDKRLDAEFKATQSYNAELQALVAQRDKLGTMGGKPEEAIARELKSLADFQEEYNRQLETFGPVVAASMAREYQARQRVLDIQREGIDLERKAIAALKEREEREAATRAAARATSDVQAQNAYLSSLDTSSPSAKKDYELFKYRQELEASPEGFDAEKYTRKSADLDAQFQQDAITGYTERLNSLAQSMATLGDDTGQAALEIELMRGALAGLDEAQKDSLRSGEGTLAYLRKRLETGDRVADTEKQGELARAQTARARLEIEWKYQDAAKKRRREDLQKEGVNLPPEDPRMTTMEAEARGAEGRAADRQDLFERTREAGDTLRDTISGALHEGFENGVGSGVSSMLKRLAEMGIDASIQKMATKWTRGILGDDSVGDAKGGLFDVMKGGTGKGAPPLDILGQIGGFAGGNLGDGLAGAAAGLVGSTPAAAQTLTLMPQLVNVQAQSANITIGSANISVGATVGAGKMAGAPGSKPTGEQTAIQVLGGLFGALR